MANSFNATSSSTPRMTHPYKYRIKPLIICVVLPFYISHLLLSYLFLFLKLFSKCLTSNLYQFVLFQISFPYESCLWQYCILICITFFYLSHDSLMGSHTNSCQFIPFSPNDLLVKGLVHQIWSLSAIHAQFILYCLIICLLWVWSINNSHYQ